ncbi:DUF2345 domain-containing protein [Enterobacter hormaechei]|uniref:contractile injection system protein, VgrG/Pvc8 family n=1 Tax=Enterobacter hormaechei TaxID=158836 RepID=UPI001E2A2F30|nr:contractile injection system protein, VgrG/Pvc8 family [Enterobacter hormaechei]MCC4520479.1 DUF2345 domain-containing protein [Enterobacter hormaechei]MCC4542350.1 DUF2345 domain-containing protein [Enterobacter hormaechei]MCC4551889.1 DUF2345 domain-containing protein [Enterobacter hormaechei]
MSGESEVAQRQDTLNRYLLYFPRSKNVISDVHSFTGKEILSEPYRYTIRFTSPDLNIAINAVLNQRAEFILRAPNLEASWHGQTSWLPVRQINGTITQFSRLMSSGDEALYECVLEHELALLDQNYRSAVYMNMTVPELVTKLMKDSGHFDGYNIDFDQLSHSYPRREMIVQWKETDLRFIRRLLAEIGIWFRFENHNKVKTETVVIFGDSARRYNFSDKQMPYVRHSGMTSYSEYITDLEEQHGLIPKGQEHIKISTEYGKGQVSVGHLVDAEGKKRGEGVEARTDDWMALRAAKGVMITTEAQPRAGGKQLDMTAAIAQLEKALSLAMTLQQSALTAGASNVETDRQNALSQTLSHLAEPGILAYGKSGIALVTPDSLQLSAGKDLIATAGGNASVNVVKKFSLAVGEKLSLFARKLGIQMIAGAGDITTQAQRGEMHMLSQQDFTLTSTAGKMNGSARKGMQFVCGGGGIRISPTGLVTIFSPTGIELKAPSLKYDGPESVSVPTPSFEKGAFKLRYKLHAGDDPEQILANKKFRLTSASGQVVEGVTDSCGRSPLLDADDLDSYKMEIME